jgi:glycosyltransferase involved in cell wall biosynthesis
MMNCRVVATEEEQPVQDELDIRFLGDARSVHLLRFVRFFARRGHDVRVASFRTAMPEFRDLGVRIADTPDQSPRLLVTAARGLANLPRLLRAARQDAPDIVHAHGALSYGLLARLAGRPYVLTPWGSDLLVHARESRILGRLARHIVSRAAICLYDGGDHMRQRLLELGAQPNRMGTFQFGVDIEIFAPARRSDDLRRELGAEPDGFLVISARNLAPIYDVGTLIRAAPLVLHEVPTARFLIGSDGPERGNLERLAAELGVADRVRFMGRMPPERLCRYFASADAYVSTSLSDAGIASSTAEAMACGVPAVITDFGDNGSWVRDGENGFLFALKDAEALAGRLVALARSPELRERCGRANVEKVRRDNNYYIEMGRIETIYRRLIAEGPDACLR